MAYTITKDLETGNALIDSEHRQWMDAINNLLNACSAGKGRAELNHTMEFLKQYTAKHFHDEEQLQLKTGYPDFTHHKQYHEGFKQVVNQLADELSKTGASIVLVGKINHSMGDWFINHIKQEDKKLAAYIDTHK